MDKQDYLAGIGELYAAEVLSEALANRWLELTTDPIERYKIGLFLQLESEAKVRLRPLLARYGISLVEDEKQKAASVAEAEHFATHPWKEAMTALSPLCLPYANRFQSLLEVAPPEDAPLLRFMIDHVSIMNCRYQAWQSVRHRANRRSAPTSWLSSSTHSHM